MDTRVNFEDIPPRGRVRRVTRPRGAPFFPAQLTALGAFLAIGYTAAVSSAAPLLPDVFSWENEQLNYMHGGFFDRSTDKHKVLYRFTGVLPNIGAGPLEVREVTHPNGTQDVYQRIHDDEVGITETLIGSFPGANPTFGHLWLEGIAQYNLRTVTPGDGVGPIVSSMDKTSMALLDGVSYNTSLPSAPPAPVYDDPDDPILGVSVGWADYYGASLPGQWVEVTGLPSGEYWLEVIADPYDRIEESDESNNITRIKVDLDIPQPIFLPGDFNEDGSVDAADYVAWRKGLGTDYLPPDYDTWRAYFGQSTQDGASSDSTVPEPASPWLAGIGAAVHAVFRRSSRGRRKKCSGAGWRDALTPS